MSPRLRMARCGLAMVVGLLALAVPAGAAAQTYLVVVTGLGGEAKYDDAFHQWATTLIDVATTKYDVPRERVAYLSGAREEGRGDARATRDELSRTVAELARRAEPNAVVFLVLLGHGSGDGVDARLNLPGPDVTAGELGDALHHFPTQQLVVVNAASASGAWIAPLTGPRRTIITATRSAYERNETKFGGFFTAAFGDAGADTDKDDRVSVLEAFQYARQHVARVYESERQLLTEHALLDDDGDGKGTGEPGADDGDGATARRLFLDPGRPRPAAAAGDAELARLYATRDSLEGAVGALRARKDALSAADYDAELERLLLALARANREIQERTGSR